MTVSESGKGSQIELAALIEKEIRSFARHSPLNRMPMPDIGIIFDKPMVQFADGDDSIFTKYKTIIHPTHLTPREALAKAYDKYPDDMPPRLSVISWILPITNQTRESNRQCQKTPSRLWAYTRHYGEKFNEALRKHMVDFLSARGFLAVAPILQPYFKITGLERVVNFLSQKGSTSIVSILEPDSKTNGATEGNKHYSNWSERHIAYAAGLGTFGLSAGFITERGIAHRCGSVVTGLELPASPRTASGPYSNCLSYAGSKCQACIQRCPGRAITEKGYDKSKCLDYQAPWQRNLSQQYGVEISGCGFCQTGVPCEFTNPTKKLKNKEG